MATELKQKPEVKEDWQIQQCKNGFILMLAPRRDRDFYTGYLETSYCFNTPEDLAKFIRKYYSKP